MRLLFAYTAHIPRERLHAFFARAGFTAAARQTAEAAGALLVDLKRLDTDLLAARNRTW